MKIAVFGAGAVGGCAGAVLARAGHEVSLIARGAHRDAMIRRGLTIRRGDEDFTVRPAVPGTPVEAGPQDVVIVAIKAHDIGAAAEAIQPLLRDDTAVICAQNGVPWWFFHRLGGPWDGCRLAAVDGDGRALRLIGLDRAVGCVITGAFDVEAPGVIRCGGLARYAIGTPAEGLSPRLEALSRALTASWLEVPAVARFRDAVWTKLLGNASLSMVCVLAGTSNGEALADAAAQRLIRALMDEVRAVGGAIGVRLAPDAGDRLIAAVGASTHKPSTLVDLERGRRMEIDAILGAVCEIGRIANVPTPMLDMIYALVHLRAERAGCYPANPGFALDPAIRSELPVT